MKKRTKQTIISVTTIVVFLLALFSGTLMSQVEMPLYQVNDKESSFEIRQYPPLKVAEVTLTGERKSAISDGFKILGSYLFGNNNTSQRIAMTAPVIQQNSEELKDAEPVLQTKENDQWKIRFLIPKKYTLEDLPKPIDSRITILELPAQTYATVRFSGLSTQANLSKNLALLKEFMKAKALKAQSSPIYAYYNPPWTLPFLRRNEIWIAIQS